MTIGDFLNTHMIWVWAVTCWGAYAVVSRSK